MQQRPLPTLIRFGEFEFNPQTEELRRRGLRLKLSLQSAQVLSILLERAGELVTRQELQKQLWHEETFVDFDHGLNNAVNKLREVLGDSTARPRFIETLPRRGYRFLATADVIRSVRPSGKVMLAVLPFRNLSRDPDQDYFADGLTEEMIVQLGRLQPESLGVIACTTMMLYKSSEKTADAIAGELQVDYILEGSVRREGTRVRITAQLIQSSDEAHLWADSYQRELSDILRVQHSVARAVAAQIRLQLSAQAECRLATAGSVNPTAYDAYLKGRYHFNRYTPDGLARSIHYYQAAIAAHPGYAQAHAALAEAYTNLSFGLGAAAPRDCCPKARQAAAAALEADDSLAVAHALMGWTLLVCAWDWRGAEQELRQALALNRNSVEAHYYYSILLSALMRHEEALAEACAAKELDPLSLLMTTNIGWRHQFARRFAEAIAMFQKALEMSPEFFAARGNLGETYLLLGQPERALAEFEQMAPLGDSPWPVELLARAYSASGQKDRAEQMKQKLLGQAHESYVPPYRLALLSVGLGQYSQALDWLERAYEERDTWLIFSKTDPRLDPLRKDIRFRSLLRRIGFVSRTVRQQWTVKP